MPIYFGLLTGLLAAPTGDRSQRVGRNEPGWDHDHSGQVGNAAWIARKRDLPPLEHVRFVDRRARRADRADRHAEDRGVVPSQRSALLVRLSQCDRFYPIPLRRAVKRCVAAARGCSGASAGMAQQEPTKHARTGERIWTQGRDGCERVASTASHGADVAGMSPISGSGERSPGADVAGASAPMNRALPYPYRQHCVRTARKAAFTGTTSVTRGSAWSHAREPAQAASLRPLMAVSMPTGVRARALATSSSTKSTW